MDDKELIEWLEREGAINIQTKARPIFKAAAARLRELVAHNKLLRAECRAGRNVLRPGASQDACKEYAQAKDATDARNALEEKA